MTIIIIKPHKQQKQLGFIIAIRIKNCIVDKSLHTSP